MSRDQMMISEEELGRSLEMTSELRFSASGI